jgi:hypothetical protein
MGLATVAWDRPMGLVARRHVVVVVASVNSIVLLWVIRCDSGLGSDRLLPAVRTVPDEANSKKHSQIWEKQVAQDPHASLVLGGSSVSNRKSGDGRTCRLSIRKGCVDRWVASATMGQRLKALSYSVGQDVLYDECQIASRCRNTEDGGLVKRS